LKVVVYCQSKYEASSVPMYRNLNFVYLPARCLLSSAFIFIVGSSFFMLDIGLEVIIFSISGGRIPNQDSSFADRIGPQLSTYAPNKPSTQSATH
jgi:hypothetical protein